MSRLQHVPPALRPRERLLRHGAATLSEAELWMCVAGHGSRRQSLEKLVPFWVSIRQQLSTELQAKFLQAAGAAQSARFLAVEELGRRLYRASAPTITSVRDVVLLCHELARLPREELWAFYCSTRAEVLHQERLALGGLNVVSVVPRDIFQPLARLRADSIVICHNHPSGALEPSPEDLVFTHRLRAACEIMGVSLRDHVIVAPAGYYSFAESGALDSAL